MKMAQLESTSCCRGPWREVFMMAAYSVSVICNRNVDRSVGLWPLYVTQRVNMITLFISPRQKRHKDAKWQRQRKYYVECDGGQWLLGEFHCWHTDKVTLPQVNGIQAWEN